MKRIHFPKTEAAIRVVLERGAEARKALGKAILSMSPMGTGRSLHGRSGSGNGTGELGAGAAASALPPLPPLHDVLKDLWSKPVKELPVTKDIARLARRTDVVIETDGKEEKIFNGKAVADALIAKMLAAEKGADSAAASSGDASSVPREVEQKAIAELVVNLVLLLAGYVESKERVAEIEKKLRQETLPKFSGTSDIISFCEDVVSVLGEDNSPTVRIMKTIQQEIILHSTIMLKEQLTKKYFTKDVRTPDGWKIVVVISDQRIQVVHIRKEQSIDERGSTANHWEYEWELRMLFSRDMTEMHSVQLRITDLYLAETIDPSLEEDLRKTIVGDIIVV